MNEEDVYIKTKKFLLENNWKPLGGDPPKGTDLPRLEIKKPGKTQSLRKNGESIINDLVFEKNGKILLIENKPSFDRGDVKKLRELTSNREWRISILEAMKSRNLLSKLEEVEKEDIVSGECLFKVLAFGGRPRSELNGFVQICWNGGQRPIIEVGGDVGSLPEPFSNTG